MFNWSKAPARGLGKATKNLSNTDSKNQRFEKSFATNFSTSGFPNTSHSPRTRHASSSAKERQRAEREQLTRLLKESPGKRDARNFLKQFDAPKKSVVPPKSTPQPNPQQAASEVGQNEWGSMRIGVNLGMLYQPTITTRDLVLEEGYIEETEEQPLHLALIKLRLPQKLSDRILGGIALTLSQMAQLGLSTAVVLDCDEDTRTRMVKVDPEYANLVSEQAARLVAALEDYHEPGALLVEHALSYSRLLKENPTTAEVRGSVEVENGYLVFPPIYDGVIPVITPFAYDKELKKVRVQADEVLLALIRDATGLTEYINNAMTGQSHDRTIEKPMLDRIILLDPLGGIPSENRADGAHAFVNLEAEYRDIEKQLRRLMLIAKDYDNSQRLSSLGSSNPFSKFVEEEIMSMPSARPQQIEDYAPSRHLKNLEVVERGLKLLPPSSSGLIITPLDAATKAIPDDAQSSPSKNPLLHNLLTDKPMVSSSLPTSPATHFLGSATPNPATFLKKGMPVTMIPDPRNMGPWQPPSSSNPSIDLAEDPRINFPKLVELINDSFQRKLDAKSYLDRIRGRVAGIIIAGDYEGGAICTWETPSPLLNTKIPSKATHDSPYWIPYLDKFAVLTSSQGSGGVSDIVWAALTRTCFPEGVVWRSRTSNPVNKWYQERSKGMWNLPGDQWTMFWTTEGVQQAWTDEQWGTMGRKDITRWEAYVDVCKGIQPSWADGIKRLD